MINIVKKEIIENWQTGLKEHKWTDENDYRYYKWVDSDCNQLWTALPPYEQCYYEGYGKTIEEAYNDLISRLNYEE